MIKTYDDEHLLATVCSTAVANSLKVESSRPILPIIHAMDFASVELLIVIYLELKLYLARKCKTQQTHKQAVKYFP